MFEDLKVSVVIPCLNEELALPSVFAKIPPCIDEVIFVDNGSTDNSIQVAQRFTVNVVIEKEKGYGAALKKGIQSSNGDVLVLLDGDGTYPVEEIENILRFMCNKGFDFVSANRFPLTNPKAMPVINIISNSFISWLARVLLKINIRDLLTGMVIFKKKSLSRVTLQARGMEFTQEIKIKFYSDVVLRCAEYHIDYSPRIGKSKFKKIKDSIEILSAFFKFWFFLKKK